MRCPFRYAALVLVGLLGLVLPARLASAGAADASLNRKLPEIKFDGVGFSDCVDFLRDVSGSNINVNWKALAEANITKDSPISVRVYAVSMRKALSLVLNQASGGDGLTFYVEDNVIEITTKAVADKVLYVRVYPVEDILLDVPDFTDAPAFDIGSSSGGGGGGSGGSRGGGGGSGKSGGGGNGLFGQGAAGGAAASTDVHKSREDKAKELVDLITATIQPEIWRDNGGTASIRYFNGSLIVSAPRSVHEALGGSVN